MGLAASVRKGKRNRRKGIWKKAQFGVQMILGLPMFLSLHPR
jgi:hypothetical protein